MLARAIEGRWPVLGVLRRRRDGGHGGSVVHCGWESGDCRQGVDWLGQQRVVEFEREVRKVQVWGI